MWKGLAVDGAFTLVFGTVAEIRHVGAHPVAGEKADTSVNLADKIVMRPVASLAPYASNSRTHNV